VDEPRQTPGKWSANMHNLFPRFELIYNMQGLGEHKCVGFGGACRIYAWLC
jgi:hypothetical protein